MPLGGSIKCLGKSTSTVKVVTGAVDNGSGLIRITATAHGFLTGDWVVITDVTGTVEANGRWQITKIDANTFDLIGSAFVNAYVAGGSASKPQDLLGNYPELRVGPGVWSERANSLAVQALPGNTGSVYVGVFGIDRLTLKGVIAGGILSPGQTLSGGLVRAPNALTVTEIYFDADTDGDGVIASYMPF